MSISRVFLDIEDVFEVELEWKADKVVVWYWHGDDRKIGHISLNGQPEIFVKNGGDRHGMGEVVEAHLEQAEAKPEYEAKTGPETRARVIELLSNTRNGYTVEQLVTFVPSITTKSSMWTVLHDLRKLGVDIQKGPSPYGGRARAFWIAS
tara:strand:- start:530 stop:979 length:450 start_codon:yes stop_codon:yes gene_type:complete